jgi:hypothetical protein
MRDMRIHAGVQSENLKGGNYCGDLEIDERVVLIIILKK